MPVGLPQQISKISNSSLPSFESPITPTDSSHNLDFIFDISPSFSKQISSSSSACNYHIQTPNLKTAYVITTSCTF